MPETEDQGADAEVHYVSVEQDPDQSPKEPETNFVAEGKPQFIINLFVLFKVLQLLLFSICAFTFRSWIGTLDAWSLGTYALLLVC